MLRKMPLPVEVCGTLDGQEPAWGLGPDGGMLPHVARGGGVAVSQDT